MALLSGHSVVTATGSGSAILSPLERTFLSSTISKTTYTWNNQDRLTGVTTPDGTRHGYTYDYRARRVQTSRSNGPLPAQTTTLVFSGGLSLAEYESSTPGAITAHAPTVHYLRGPDMGGGVGGMLYSIRGSTLKYSLSNGRGDIVAQSDENASITWTASYEAFGKRPAETGTNLDKQRANSKDEDPTGLLNEGFRYRDLETGTFISRDPAGFLDGPNLYAYVMQNPWSNFDPNGLWSWSAFGKGLAAGALIAGGAVAAIALAPVLLPAMAATTVTAGIVAYGGASLAVGAAELATGKEVNVGLGVIGIGGRGDLGLGRELTDEEYSMTAGSLAGGLLVGSAAKWGGGRSSGGRVEARSGRNQVFDEFISDEPPNTFRARSPEPTNSAARTSAENDVAAKRETKYHGNDRRNPNPQHNYDILNKDGQVRKNGVGTGEAKDGVSKRAESQLDEGDTYRITDQHSEGPGARGRAYDRERERSRQHYEAGEPMDKHERPKP